MAEGGGVVLQRVHLQVLAQHAVLFGGQVEVRHEVVDAAGVLRDLVVVDLVLQRFQRGDDVFVNNRAGAHVGILVDYFLGLGVEDAVDEHEELLGPGVRLDVHLLVLFEEAGHGGDVLRGREHILRPTSGLLTTMLFARRAPELGLARVQRAVQGVERGLNVHVLAALVGGRQRGVQLLLERGELALLLLLDHLGLEHLDLRLGVDRVQMHDVVVEDDVVLVDHDARDDLVDGVQVAFELAPNVAVRHRVQGELRVHRFGGQQRVDVGDQLLVNLAEVRVDLHFEGGVVVDFDLQHTQVEQLLNVLDVLAVVAEPSVLAERLHDVLLRFDRVGEPALSGLSVRALHREEQGLVQRLVVLQQLLEHYGQLFDGGRVVDFHRRGECALV